MPYVSVNPFTGETLARYANHSDLELDALLTRADKGFSGWRERSFEDRGSIIGRAAALLRERREALAATAVREMGKLIGEARQEVNDSADIMEWYAGNAARLLADEPAPNRKGDATVQCRPLGVVFCVEPWNYPYYQVARVVGPHLMAGNVMMLKHASGTPQCALAWAEVMQDAGAPAGVYTNVFLTQDQCATAIADRRVKAVALTGSGRAGAAVAAEAGRALKKSTMELGGSDAFIVLDDADLDAAVDLAVQGRMQNAGQACAGSKRFVVDAKLYDAFLPKFRGKLEALSPGDPMNEATTLAPLCSERALERAEAQVRAAVDAGATLLMGGHRIDRAGWFLAPAILTGVTPDNPVYREELFAPVAMVFRADDADHAVAIANDSPFGLGGTVVTTDDARGRTVAERMDTGMVFINDTVVSIPELPFGGVRGSGFGRELSGLGIQEFVSKKLVFTAPARKAA